MAPAPGTRSYAPWGTQRWRDLVLTDDNLSFAQIARDLDEAIHRIFRMSRGQLPPTQELRDYLVKRYGIPQDKLFSDDAVKLRLDLLDEDGDRS